LGFVDDEGVEAGEADGLAADDFQV
jgi:hypothetical protein